MNVNVRNTNIGFDTKTFAAMASLAESFGRGLALRGVPEKDAAIQTENLIAQLSTIGTVAHKGYNDVAAKMSVGMPEMEGGKLKSQVGFESTLQKFNEQKFVSPLAQELGREIKSNLDSITSQIPAETVLLEKRTDGLEQQAKVNNQVEANKFAQKFAGTEVNNSNKIAGPGSGTSKGQSNDLLPG
jgi:hypothetical protein